jgi:hypothetical protein
VRRPWLVALFLAGCASPADSQLSMCQSVFSSDYSALRFERQGPFIYGGGAGGGFLWEKLSHSEQFERTAPGVYVPARMPQELRGTVGVELFTLLQEFDTRQRRACELRALFPADDPRHRAWAKVEGAQLFVMRFLLLPVAWETSVSKVGRERIASVDDVLAGKASMDDLLPDMIIGLQRFQID